MKLNKEQQHALDVITSSEPNKGDVFVLRGPAGTGKTTVATSIISQIDRKNVVISAPTLTAISVLKTKLSSHDLSSKKMTYRSVASILTTQVEYIDVMSMRYYLEESDMTRLKENMLQMVGIDQYIPDFVKEVTVLKKVKNDFTGKYELEETIKYLVDSEKVKLMLMSLFGSLPDGAVSQNVEYILVEPEVLVDELKDMNLLVIDEWSMGSEDQVKLILNTLDIMVSKGIKAPTILFIGDKYQIEPVNEEMNHLMTTPPDNETVFELKEVVRSSDRIVQFATAIRYGGHIPNMLDMFSDIIHDDSDCQDYMDICEKHRDELKDAMFITFTNKNVDKLNMFGRGLRGFNDSVNVQDNETLMALNNCGVKEDKSVTFANGEELIVDKVYTVEESIALYKMSPQYQLLKEELLGDMGELEDIDTYLMIGEFVLADLKNRLGDVNRAWIQPQLLYKSKQTFRELEIKLNGLSDLLNGYCPVLRATFGYARTVHKSQGSEWDNVIYFTSLKDLYKKGSNLPYTASTRAKHNLQVRLINHWQR